MMMSDEQSARREDTSSGAGQGQESRRGWRRWLSKFWITRQMAIGGDSDREIQTTLRELVIYIVFLFVFNMVALGMSSPEAYYFSKIVKMLFVETAAESNVEFKSITQMTEFWSYVENDMMESFFWDYWTDPKDKKTLTGETEEEENMLRENKLLGIPRMRQIKVKNNSCEINSQFKGSYTTCYDFYSKTAEDKEPFGLKQGTAWTYSSESQLSTSSYIGLMGTYGGGGFYQDLSLDRNETIGILKELKENLWLTRGTRVVFIDFTAYNPNVNLFCVSKLTVEFPPTGGAFPTSSFKPVRLVRYHQAFDYFILACEFIFIFFIIYYTMEELRELIHFNFNYFFQFWNFIDVSILAASYFCIVYSIYSHISVLNKLDILLKTKDAYANFDELGSSQKSYNNIEAVALFFAWIKVIKFVSFTKSTSEISNTISRCVTDLLGFVLMFFTLFISFAILAYLIFGCQVERFSHPVVSLFSLLRIIQADFDYDELDKASKLIGPIYFIFFILIFYFVLTNMFLAIICDTYSSVKSEIAVKRQRELKDIILGGFRKLVSRGGSGNEMTAAGEAPEGGNKITFKDIRNTLVENNFSELEIAMFFNKYDIDPHHMVHEAETQKLLDDYERRGYVPASVGLSSHEEFSELSNRVEAMEKSIALAAKKVEAIMEQVEDLVNVIR
ncbi:unnamed protein product [Timema podura]|uniref:Polycystic kidney disease 2-like 1 protein n=1 Tax=Timema podura TaxID=61482 RepID=A0ABN7P8R9_TIMPD|nr:unnamed protein product [Timema podura]